MLLYFFEVSQNYIFECNLETNIINYFNITEFGNENFPNNTQIAINTQL